MKTISLCMIVKNEEDTVGNCLESVANYVDEIIVVDTGSTDATKEIVSKYTDKIYDFTWCNDFSAARNESFSKATKDYILWMDADDILKPEDQRKMCVLKETLNDDIDIVMAKYNVGFDEHGKVILSYYRERLVKRSDNFKWIEPVHELIKTSGNILVTDLEITHAKKHSSGDRNIRIFDSIVKRGKELSPRGLYYYAKELYGHGRIEEAIKYFESFISKEDGWVEDKIHGCYLLSICYSRQGEKQKALEILYKSFLYDLPRAEICCRIADYYLEIKSYRRAIYWYKIATKQELPKLCIGFILPEYSTYIPNVQLSLCYIRIGDIENARKYNEIAAKYKPDGREVLQNIEYLKSHEGK